MTRLTYRVHDTDRPDDWRDEAICRQYNPDLFFTDGKGQTEQIRAAQAICHGCPVRIRCGEYAIQAGEYWGIWGGMNQTQLRTARRRREQRADLQRGSGTQSPAGRAKRADA
ncbi:WhiB family transcriptional regulator [Streptomyces naphthomycinicus]|uniref:WhiB family transcriptional regulator n=1 Tax=Streptomyces naphthomycinicus TaxID=2872625 RepID=UPI001CEC8C44|nr:WhiB family transcriptional regulator [Streptomyces sp. TML10]